MDGDEVCSQYMKDSVKNCEGDGEVLDEELYDALKVALVDVNLAHI